MANKLEKELVEKLAQQQEAKAKIQSDLGTLELQKHALLHAFAQVQSEQDAISKEIEEKHGKVQIDLKTGEITPIEEEAEVVE